MPNETDDGTEWMSVIGRSLAFLCLQHGDMRDKSIVEQAEFLMGLGVSRKDAAAIMGSTDESLRVSLATAKKRGGAKKGAAKKKTATKRG